MINLIVCRDNNNGIGKDNKLLYHISDDLKRFKELTTNNIVVMGRKTFESLGNKPLPNRHNVVLTHDSLYFYYENEDYENLEFTNYFNYILNYNENNPKKEIFIIGGQSIYEQFLPIADKIYLTQVDDNSKEADTFFNFDKTKFELIKSVSKHDDKNNLDYYFKDYIRIEK